jgi:N-acetylmuramoyl-L-alanine amidase
MRRGDHGEAVRDLQQRLAANGIDSAPDDLGEFGDATEAALRAFQQARGLRVDGICGRETWAALVESGWELGDRLLYLRSPNLRGDDVSELQRRLNALGFHAGREDGILGPETAGAVREFQRNAGVAVDGICGPDTVDTLNRLGTLAAGSVASVREREELRQGPRRLDQRKVFLVAAPGLEGLADVVDRSLSVAGARVIVDLSGADDSSVAAEANRFGADLCLALRLGDEPDPRCHYFASGSFRSEAGYRLARAIQPELERVLGRGGANEPCGRTYSLLRETRMAAVVCEPVAEGDPDAMGRLVSAIADVGHAIARGVQRGIEDED